MAVTGTYNPYLVALSLAVAAFASYTALDLGGRVSGARGLARSVWLVASATAMGVGIWSMHFIGMLAFILPMPMSYAIGPTVASLVVAIVVTGIGFTVIGLRRASGLPLIFGGIFMGLGISAMHYIGIAAMREQVLVRYESIAVGISIAIAIGASLVALALAFRTTDVWQKVLAALVMGVAISGMHYSAMMGTHFTTREPAYASQALLALDQTTLAMAVAGTTFLILAFSLIASLSEQKRTEQALRKAQADLAHFNRVTTMGELTASLAHEVKQPIAAAVCNANACLGWLDGEAPNIERARVCCTRIINDGTHATEIVQHIRALFEQAPPKWERLVVNELVRELIILLRSELSRYTISVRTHLAEDAPEVLGDRVQLQQVIMNLIVNSIEATREIEGRREIIITSRRDEDGQLRLCVSDSGVGLPLDAGERIFRAFFTTKPHGVGMGLSICRSIVESHSGHLWADDNVPRGASFHMVLPTAVSAAPPPYQPFVRSASDGRPTLPARTL